MSAERKGHFKASLKAFTYDAITNLTAGYSLGPMSEELIKLKEQAHLEEEKYKRLSRWKKMNKRTKI
jgi:hypothetical protein